MKIISLLLLGTVVVSGQFNRRGTWSGRLGSRTGRHTGLTGQRYAPANLYNSRFTARPQVSPGKLPFGSPDGGMVAATVDDEPRLQSKFADGTGALLLGGQTELSGCGIHRDCYTCMSSSPGKCMWAGDTGCIASNGLTNGIDPLLGLLICSANGDNAIGKTCPQISDCTSCTEVSGCIWNRGSCTYSRGDGCLHDPFNCANYAHQCPAPDASPVIVVEQEDDGLQAVEVTSLAAGGLGGLAGLVGTDVASNPLLLAALAGSGAYGDANPLALAAATGSLGLSDIPGWNMFPDRDIGLLNGLIGPSLNQWSATTDVSQNGMFGLPAGQTPFCLPGDVYCNSAALDPYAPHNLNPAYDLLDDLGLPHADVYYPAYNLPGPYQAPDYARDTYGGLSRPSFPSRFSSFPRTTSFSPHRGRVTRWS